MRPQTTIPIPVGRPTGGRVPTNVKLPPLGGTIGTLPLPENFNNRYVISVISNGQTKFYIPRNYQLEMLDQLYRSPNDRVDYYGRDSNGYDIHAILIKEFDRVGQPQFKFINDRGETSYYVDATIPPVTFYEQNADQSWSLYDQQGHIITKWPLY